MKPPTKAWQAHVDQHKRVRRSGWEVVDSERSPRMHRIHRADGIWRWLPNWAELGLALVLAMLLALGWLAVVYD